MKRLIYSFVLLLAACKPDPEGVFHGYVEGEYVMISPTSGGLLQKIDVVRGQKVEAGAPLFTLDLAMMTAAREAAKADVARAEAEREDLTKGERAEEIDVVTKQRAQAQATLEQAEQEYNRAKPLAKTGAVSTSELDTDKAAYDGALARVAELDAKLKTSAMGGRVDQIAAATAALEAAKQKLVQAEKTLAEAAPAAAAAARVEDTFFRAGEYVPAGRPVVSLLPPENVKVRFFVPQSLVPKLAGGQNVTISCDGCVAPIAAKITFVSNEAEFTPPVIYSIQSRQKLVFMIEAKPDAPDAQLRPGLPVDITLVSP